MTINNQITGKDQEHLKAVVLSIVKGDKDFSQLLDLLEPSIQAASSLDNETALTLALLLSDVELQANLNDQLHVLTSDQGSPALAVSGNGHVLSLNAAANTLFKQVQGQNILALGIRQTDFDDFKDRIVSHNGPSLLRIYPNRLQNTPLIFIGRYQENHQIFLLRAIEVYWPDSINVALKEIFNLTSAERDILACLAQGMQSDQISDYRQSKTSTVRQQIKSLLQKLGATSQVQAAALAAALASQSQSEPLYSQASENKETSGDNPINNPINATLAKGHSEQGEHLRNTRAVGWRRYGQKGGIPVLLMHSGYFGAGDHGSEREFAIQAGLDVLIIERPGFGRTKPPIHNEPTITTHLQDCIEILNELNWQKAWLLSYDYGFVPALAFANQHPNRVHSILIASPLPLYARNPDLRSIPFQQRVFFWAALHGFWMIPLLLKLGHVKARKLGPENWMNMVFEGSPNELAIFQSVIGKEIASSSYHFNLIQNSKGHELDKKAYVSEDWSDLLAKTSVPITALAGQKNTTFNITLVRELLSINPSIRLVEIENAGLTLALTHADDIHSALLDAINNI
jgi:pimeloyl-ACP methyl ester carboxylesterase/DNA-binding CsgD family transcriptional regulator